MSNHYPFAGIRVTITRFVQAGFADLDPKKYSLGDVLLVTKANGMVSQPRVNDPIRVDRGAVVDLVFELASQPTDPDTYQVVGVSFFGQHGGIGMADFPTRTVTADAFGRLRLTVHDANIDGNTFEFKLVLQRERDGALGIIDPQINNA
jgi:hypothetical protein